ncbi:MAG: ATP-binding protein [Nitrospinota bacterium]|nr:ATP-binding protein [Nitrospinota bacterium]
MAESVSSENLLVKVENLDKLLTLAGEVIISSSNLGNTYKNLQALYDSKKPVNRDTVEVMGDLSAATADISSELHHLVQAIRTVSLKDLSFRTRRLVRDISRKTGKRVNFEFEGEETTVDKTIVENLYDPISHQLRNAIDHGIEDSEERKKKGKPEEGLVVIRVSNSENETIIDIEDDGAGIDLERLRKKAIELGRVNESDNFTEGMALDIMCMAGVSTAEVVSEVSGRGVGMDVVRSMLSNLGGSISFKTEKDKGSTFTFRVPLVSAVNIVDALVIRSGKHMFAFPISTVAASMSVPKKQINSTLGKGEMVHYLDKLLPLHNLNKLLDGTVVEHEGENLPVLVLEHKKEWIALSISEFLSPQKLVIIPFNGALEVEGISGTTILGGRSLGFIVDVNSLIARATGKGRRHHLSLAEAESAAGKALKKGRLETQAVKVEKHAEVADEAAMADKRPEAAARREIEIQEEPQIENVTEFILEIEKLVPQLNESIFALEKNPGDMETINLAFRLFHTIKGNLIMIGYSKGGQTVHAVESVLDYARGKKIDISPEMMDILMDGVSYIEDLVRKGKAGAWQDEVSQHVLEASARVLPEQKVEKKEVGDVVTAEIGLSHESSYRMNNYRKLKTPFYNCYVEFDSGRQPPFLVACLIYKRISEVGDVLGTVPPLEDIENGIMEGKFKLLFASSREPEKAEKFLYSVLTRHYGATIVKINRFG